METEEDLKIETEQVKYWEECLNSLAKQFEILLNSMDKMGFELPWKGNFDEFMSNKDNKLVFS